MKKPKPVQSTKQKLIEGAMSVLEEEGIAGTTTRRIAEAADVRLATLHYHFKDKDALLFAVLEEITVRMEAFLVKDTKPSNNLNQSIEQLIWALWRLVKQTRNLQILQFELTMYAVRDPETAWLAERQYEGYYQKYERILLNYKDCQLTSQDVRHLAQFLLAGLDGILVQELAIPNESRTKESFGYLIESGQQLAKRLIQK
jgi:AcrR family transcriptional regulator